MYQAHDSINEIRYYLLFFVVLSAIIIIILERLFPYNNGQKFLREGFFNDFILYNFLQSFVLGIVISYVIQFIDEVTMLSHYRLMSAFPVWLQVVFFVITHDFYIYWFHRFQHRSKILWRIHEAHHSTKSVDWLSGVRSHSLEILINQTVEFAPIVLLGASPETAVYKGAISAVWGMYIHSNINARSGWLQYIINGPEMHRWHHSNEENMEHLNKNFSTKLAVWDWIFGTAYRPERKSSVYGIDNPDYPSGYIGQHLYAFRKFRKKQ